MGGYSVGETSIPGRLSEVERALHTVQFRLDQLDQHRLPDRMVGVEAAMRKVEDSIADLKVTTTQTIELLRDTRSELNDDLNAIEEGFNTRMMSIQSSLDKLIGKIVGAVAASTVFVGAIVWVLEQSGFVDKFFGG